MTEEKDQYKPDTESTNEPTSSPELPGLPETEQHREFSDQPLESSLETIPPLPPYEDVQPEPLGFLELLYGVLFDPWNTLESVAKNPPVGIAFIIATIVMIASVISGLLAIQGDVLALNQELGYDFSAIFSGFSMVALVFFIMFMYFLFLFLFSGYLHLFGEFLGGSGSSIGVFVLVCLSQLPYIFTVPVNIILPYLGTVGMVFAGVISIGVYAWGIVILVIGLEKTINITTGKAVLAVLSPIILGIVFIVLLIVLVIAFVAAAGSGGIWY